MSKNNRLLRFATIDGVKENKSTFTGRFLCDSRSVIEDRLEEVEAYTDPVKRPHFNVLDKSKVKTSFTAIKNYNE